jgi:hypothetical protein
MIQKATFHDGGFVLHKISSGLVRHRNYYISAWFSPAGTLLDAQFMPSERQVVPGSPSWKKAERMGLLHNPHVPRSGPCGCRPGIWRDNCPDCEGTGLAIDWRKYHAIRKAERGESV